MIVKTVERNINEDAWDFGRPTGNARKKIVEVGDDCYVQTDAVAKLSKTLTICCKKGHGVIFSIQCDSHSGFVSISSFLDMYPPARGVKQFFADGTFDDGGDTVKTATRIWKTVRGSIDLDDAEYTIEQVNKLVPQIIRKYDLYYDPNERF